MGVARGGRTGSVWARLWAQTLSFEWPCDSTPFSSFRVRCGVEGCILSVRCFCANAGFSRLRRFTLGFSRLCRFTQGKWIRLKRQHEARARARGVCVRHAHACVCVTGSCDGELGRSPASSLHPGPACVARLGTGGCACGSSEYRARRSPVSWLH